MRSPRGNGRDEGAAGGEVVGVVGTAGHVDHGKTTLVRALTGVDCDRLAEEKRRGMTIDLGFAPWRLPGGAVVGVVDVPGHRRLIRTMVAGASGIDVVLLVVAADEGVMPQTHEHLAICDLLGTQSGVVALSKCDLVDPEVLELARAEVDEVVAQTALRGAELVACSATTGAGLTDLGWAVERALARCRPRPDRGRPRLWVDRSFARPGFGTIVTGTLEGGSLEVGEEVVVLPRMRRARVRGLQHHGSEVVRALPGRRTAVNLAGVDHHEVRRGDAVVRPGNLAPTARLDARLRLLGDAPAPLRHRSRVDVLLGTAEVRGEVWLLRGSAVEPGADADVQLFLETPVAAAFGDRFVVRRPSPPATLGGGVVLDVAPRRHRRNDAAVAASLERRRTADLATLVADELAKERLGVEVSDLGRRLGLAAPDVEAALHRLGGGVLCLTPERWLAAARWAELRRRSDAVLSAFHDAEPLRPGMPREAWRSRLRLPGGPVAAAVVARLVAEGAVVERGPDLALVGRGGPDAAAEAAADALVARLEARGLDPPTPEELRRAGLTPALLHHLLAASRVVRLGDLVLAASAVAAARQRVEELLRERGSATVAEIRDALGATRRVVVPLLEHLDATRVTLREGDRRRLRPSRGGPR